MADYDDDDVPQLRSDNHKRINVRCFDIITVEFNKDGSVKPPKQIIDELQYVLYELEKKIKHDRLIEIKNRIAHLRDRRNGIGLYMIDMDEADYLDYYGIIDAICQKLKLKGINI